MAEKQGETTRKQDATNSENTTLDQGDVKETNETAGGLMATSNVNGTLPEWPGKGTRTDKTVVTRTKRADEEGVDSTALDVR